jgi:hypothetical protein
MGEWLLMAIAYMTFAAEGGAADGLGRHPAITRHAYLPGAVRAICGLRMTRMATFVPGQGSWGQDGDLSPRCAECDRAANV